MGERTFGREDDRFGDAAGRFGSSLEVATWSPADGSVNVHANTSIVLELTYDGGVDPSLVEIVVEGTTHTVANGGLEYWGNGRIDGTAMVEDYSDLHFRVVPQWWYTGGLQVVSVEVFYDSFSVGTASFTASSVEGFSAASTTQVMAYATTPHFPVGSAEAKFVVTDIYVGGASYDVRFQVREQLFSYALVKLLVAHQYTHFQDAAGIVGELTISNHEAAGIVQGLQRDYHDSAGIVQGPARFYLDAAGVVGVRFIHHHEMSGIVGTEVIGYLDAAGLVYKSIRNTVIEVEVQDATTRAVLESLGVTFS